MTKVVFSAGVSRTSDETPQSDATALWRLRVVGDRLYAWASAADGEAGVAKLIDLFREELQNAILVTGCVMTSNIESFSTA